MQLAIVFSPVGTAEKCLKSWNLKKIARLIAQKLKLFKISRKKQFYKKNH